VSCVCWASPTTTAGPTERSPSQPSTRRADGHEARRPASASRGCSDGDCAADDYAEQYLDDIGAVQIAEAIPTWIQPYLALDIEGFARDLVLGGEVVAIEDVHGIHIFEGNMG